MARENPGDRRKIARVVVAGLALGIPIATVAKGQEFDGPSFRRGMWQFERTLAHVGASPHLPAATFLSKHQVTRCVNPTEAMKETFRPTTVGSCRSAKPDKIENRYVFSMRCDFIGPVRTVIEVESDSAYAETHESVVGIQRKETIIARRIGDCEEQEVIALPAKSKPSTGAASVAQAQ